jgi:putative FmdB family regulatory protein
MPIYEYVCGRCGDRLEVLQRLTDKALVKCKKCGGRLEKLISASSFVFKGSGWYVTDYARKGRTDSGESGSSRSKSTDPASGKGSTTE